MIPELEVRGVETVPKEERTEGWFVLFAMYAGINICLPMMLMGGWLIPGLSFLEVALVGLVSSLIAFSITALASYPGTEHGTPVSVLSRLWFGFPLGSWIPSVVIAVSLVGWSAIQTELAASAASGIVQGMTGISSPLLMTALIGTGSIFFAVMGFAWMNRLASIAVPALLLLGVALFIRIGMEPPFLELVTRPGNGSLSLLTGLNFMLSGQIVFAFTASDISRYARGGRSAWVGIGLGVTPVTVFVVLLGALSALSGREWGSAQGVQNMGLGLGALFLIVLATWTTNDKNLYSGGLALANLFPNQPRWRHSLLLGVIGTSIACLRLTPYFAQWRVAVGVVFAPLLAILLVDYFLIRRRRFASTALHQDRGINWIAVTAFLAGAIAGYYAPPQWIQPLVALVVTAGSYWAGMHMQSTIIKGQEE